MPAWTNHTQWQWSNGCFLGRDTHHQFKSSTVLHCFHKSEIKKCQNGPFLFLNGQTPVSFSFIFGLFKQTSLHLLQQICVKKCPSSIWCRDSNPRPSERESLPITTRPSHPWMAHFLRSKLIFDDLFYFGVIRPGQNESAF